MGAPYKIRSHFQLHTNIKEKTSVFSIVGSPCDSQTSMKDMFFRQVKGGFWFRKNEHFWCKMGSVQFVLAYMNKQMTNIVK